VIHGVVNMAASTSVALRKKSLESLEARHTPRSSDLVRGFGRQPLTGQGANNVIPPASLAYSEKIPPEVTLSPTSAVKHRTFRATRMAAELFEGTGKTQVEAHLRSEYHTLIAFESGLRKEGKTVIEGLPPCSIHNLTHKLVFVPAGTEYRDQYTPCTNLSVMYFHFSPQMLSRDAQSSSAPLSPRLFFENASLWSSMQKLKEMLENPAFDNEPYFEALGVLLAREVVHVHSALPAMPPPARGGLAPWQLRIVTSYIEQHLTEAIPLATLAGLVRLSPHYFCRAFKRSLGVPPHRYHINRRIEQAKRMLIERRQSITDIGLALGFGDTSSFSEAFRKAAGITPTRYRRNAG
jgi:AraC family transcriptional regulator